MREELVRLDMAETFLNKDAAAACSSCAESFARGHSILTLRHLASAEEVAVLKAEAIGAAHARVVEASSEASVRELERRIVAMRAAYIKADQPWRTSTPLVSHGGAAASRHRMQIEHSLTAPGQALCDALLLRALSLLEAQLVHDLFGNCTTDSDTCVHNPQLAFSTNEPAINVYYSGGHFKPHEDNHALTILVPLSAASADFEGGGTAFWSTRDAGPGGSINARTMGAPTMVLRPPAGAALLWGGACTDGMPYVGRHARRGCMHAWHAHYVRCARAILCAALHMPRQRDHGCMLPWLSPLRQRDPRGAAGKVGAALRPRRQLQPEDERRWAGTTRAHVDQRRHA